MTHRSLRLCTVLGAVGIAGTVCAATLAGASVWDAARGGRLITLSWSPTPCHKEKTKQDAADRAKAQHREDAHHGIRTAPHRPIRSAPMPKRPPQRRASSELTKPRLPPRQLYVER